MTDKSTPAGGIWFLIVVLTIILAITIGLLVSTLNVRDQAVSGEATALAQVDAAATARMQAENNAATAQVRMVRSDSKRLGVQALGLLNANDSGNTELAALLSIRALRLGYNADADLALSQVLAALGGTTVRGNQLHIISDSTPLDHAVFSADGKQIIAHTGTVLKWWDIQTGAELRSLPVDGDIAAFSPDRKLVLTTHVDSGGQTWTAYLIQLETGTELQHFTSQTKYIVNARLLAGNKSVVSVGANTADKLDPIMQLWDVQTGKEMKRFTNSEFEGVLSSNGKYFVTNSKYGIEQLNAVTLTEIRKLDSDSVDFAIFSPDSRYLLTGGEDTSIILLDADSGHGYGRFNDGKAPAVFSPDSNVLVMNGDAHLHIMDVKTGIERGYVDDATGDAVFSPDSTLLLAAGTDNTAHVVDAKTGTELRVLTGHTKPINNLAFSPDGQYLMTGSEDGTVRFWKVDYRPLIAQACQRLSRDLTDAERRKFDINDAAPTCPKLSATVTF